MFIKLLHHAASLSFVYGPYSLDEESKENIHHCVISDPTREINRLGEKRK